MVDVVTDTSYVNALVAADCVLVAVRLIEHVVNSLVVFANPIAVQSTDARCVQAAVDAVPEFLNIIITFAIGIGCT
jgi:hypothetical protein